MEQLNNVWGSVIFDPHVPHYMINRSCSSVCHPQVRRESHSSPTPYAGLELSHVDWTRIIRFTSVRRDFR